MFLKLNDFNKLYKTSDTRREIRDDENRLVAFQYKRIYGTRHSVKWITVKLVDDAVKKRRVNYLPDKPFFNKLAANIDRIKNVATCDGKIYKYTLDGIKYKTSKPNIIKLFQMFNYKDFLSITRNRFYRRDDLLRNGYISGLIGTSDLNILKYEANRDMFDVYDIDINKAYTSCFDYPLPTGDFYSAAEWEKLENKPRSFMKFYHIKIKGIKNSFNAYVPPLPFTEYLDFDFLAHIHKQQMIVSDFRIDLLNLIYGQNQYEIIETYYVQTKIYAKIKSFIHQLYNNIEKEKKIGNVEKAAQLKVSLNCIVGMFAKRDSTKKISGLQLINNNFAENIIMPKYTPAEYKESNNYLPISMAINDYTALRLFNLLTNTPFLMRLCYNTDGAIVCIPKGSRVFNSSKPGEIKCKKINDPTFYYCSALYARPLVVDADGSIYNSKSLVYDDNKDRYLLEETFKLNTADGFKKIIAYIPVVTKEYTGFSIRKDEIISILNNNDIYKRYAKIKQKMISQYFGYDEEYKMFDHDYNKLMNPYDSKYNEIRHAPKNILKLYCNDIFFS